MNPVSNATLRHLIEQPTGAYVSAYLPLEHGAIGTLRNQVALKNLLKQAETRLIALGARENEAAAFLAHSRADLRDNGFWNRAGKGLALFHRRRRANGHRSAVSAGRTRFYRRALRDSAAAASFGQ
ncbi:MAG: hypothetical protein IPO29_19475 [Anaerolineae bacterium]|nr:hypothetical protein [Anaerolineae bacterium]